MSKLKDSLIAIMKQNKIGGGCEHGNIPDLDCYEVECSECPFLTQEDMDVLIKELEGEVCQKDDVVITEPF